MRILAISGSLRAASTNTTLLRAVALAAPQEFDVTLYDGMETIPPFNPDLDVEPAPEPVARFRQLVRQSDAVVFSTPEYAHGVPGSLKNTLDWVVGSGEFSEKPVTLLHASGFGTHARASLRETLQTMNARVLAEETEVTVALRGKKVTAEEIAGDLQYSTVLRSFLLKVFNVLMNR